MIYNENIAKSIANDLIRIEAVKISVDSPFTWTSGIKSPVYCDNRITLSDVDVRNNIKNSLIKCISEKFPEVNCIAGVATAGIPQGSMISDYMNLPFVYVRNKPKGHGLGNQIEGRVQQGQKVVVVEDLVSTGKSSLEAVQALRDAGCDVVGMVAIFTYGFDKTYKIFEEMNVPLWTLSDYQTLKGIKTELPEFQPEFDHV
jgi:orotate phosphoribosyltransferase